MNPINIDVVIIGAGTAGMGAYLAALSHTASVLLIEGGVYGTTCARDGCMPSKLLIAAAEAAHHARHSDPFGVQVECVSIDGAAVMARVQRERDRFVGFVLETVKSFPQTNRLSAKVRFQNANTLVTQHGQLIHARRVVIASGSTPVLPPLLKGLSTRLLTNESVFDLPTLPKSLAVFGSGILGIELGQAMGRLGVNIKIFGKGGGVVGIHDEAMRAYANETFNEEFYLDASALVKSVAETATGVDVHYLHRDGTWNTIRLLLAAIKQREIDERIQLDDTQVLTVIEKLVKQRRESIVQFEKGGRPDLVATEQAELELLLAYLPAQMSDAEIAPLVAAALAQTGAQGAADMGKVMALLKPQLAGRADMGKVSALVKSKLSN